MLLDRRPQGTAAELDYVLFNPLGSVDCLDEEASSYGGSTTGRSTRSRMVVSAEKLAEALDLFRVREDPYTILLSDAAAGVIGALGFTNSSCPRSRSA